MKETDIHFPDLLRQRRIRFNQYIDTGFTQNRKAFAGYQRFCITGSRDNPRNSGIT
jgi:hypothetical protein